MVAADRGVGIAEDLAQFGIAEQAANLVLDAFVEVGEFLADLGQLATGHVKDVTAAIDTAADRLGDGPEVFYRCEQLEKPLQSAIP